MARKAFPVHHHRGYSDDQNPIYRSSVYWLKMKNRVRFSCASASRRYTMTMFSRVCSQLAIPAALIAAALVATAHSQTNREASVPKPTLPNPYRLVPNWPTLPTSMKGPNDTKWGEVIRVHVAPNGNIWVFHRCFNDKPQGDATCLNRGEANPPILEFNPAGRLLRSFGVGLFAHPHGFTVDKDGNIWTTDTNDEETILGMPAKNAQGLTMGQEV